MRLSGKIRTRYESDFLIVNALYHENPVPESLRSRLKRLADIGVVEHIG